MFHYYPRYTSDVPALLIPIKLPFALTCIGAQTYSVVTGSLEWPVSRVVKGEEVLKSTLTIYRLLCLFFHKYMIPQIITTPAMRTFRIVQNKNQSKGS